ncbi:hypothetical protein B5X24_HaOG202276 [Helicoverpa armigera]|uniref:Uncharacterized protein n=1 Tax=Helicoverpa armigera TaxID=29058 RepID=A0A2W1BV87_HELAM|nr:hypothetical protein B5X24_HaOG202276 [Helicoverpa armigera]
MPTTNPSPKQMRTNPKSTLSHKSKPDIRVTTHDNDSPSSVRGNVSSCECSERARHLLCEVMHGARVAADRRHLSCYKRLTFTPLDSGT